MFKGFLRDIAVHARLYGEQSEKNNKISLLLFVMQAKAYYLLFALLRKSVFFLEYGYD
jgi:hypothetical protein